MLAAALAVALSGQAAVAGVRRPALPRARSATLIHASAPVSVPWACCSAPRAVSTVTFPRLTEQSGQRDDLAAGTPVTRSTRSATRAATDRRTSSNAGGASGDVLVGRPGRRRPVRAAPREPARGQCPGPAARTRPRGRRWGVRRGSTTTTSHLGTQGVEVAGGGRHGLGRFDPTSTSTSVCSTSASGKGRPRSSAERAVPRRRRGRHAPAAVVVDLAGAEGDPGELAERGRPSRWSARRHRRRPPSPVRSLHGVADSRDATRSSASPQSTARNSPVAGPESGVVSRSRWPIRPRRTPALAAHRPAVDRELLPATTFGERLPTEPHPALQRAVRAVRADTDRSCRSGPQPARRPWRRRPCGRTPPR